jgi:hypothetical protein
MRKKRSAIIEHNRMFMRVVTDSAPAACAMGAQQM